MDYLFVIDEKPLFIHYLTELLVCTLVIDFIVLLAPFAFIFAFFSPFLS